MLGLRMAILQVVKAAQGFFGTQRVGGFVGSCLRRRGRWCVLRFYGGVDPGLGFPLPMSADKFQGFDDWCE